MSHDDQNGAWLPLCDAWTVNEAAVEATITDFVDDAYLQWIEAGAPAHLIRLALAEYEQVLRAKMAECIAIGQARLRSELQGENDH